MKSILKPQVLGMAAAVLSISLGSNALMAHGMDAVQSAKGQTGNSDIMMGGMPMTNMSSGTCPMMAGNVMPQAGQAPIAPMAMMSQMMQHMSGQTAAPMMGAGH